MFFEGVFDNLEGMTPMPQRKHLTIFSNVNHVDFACL